MASQFETLRNEVDQLEILHGSLAARLDDILDRARINADDTCHVEKSAPVEAYNDIALATLSDILCYENDTEVSDWFAARGVRW